MTMLDLVDHGRQLPAKFFVQADAEGLADPVGRQPPETISQLRSKVWWMGK